MSENLDKPPAPVKPGGLELVFIYACPHCANDNPVLASYRRTVTCCQNCQKNFTIIPVEEKTVLFIKLILGNGAAAIDPDFI